MVAACAPCGACCVACGSMCGTVGGRSGFILGGALGLATLGIHHGPALGGVQSEDDQRATAYFDGDLTDPRNPGHDAWVARHDAEVAKGAAQATGGSPVDVDALVDTDHPGHRDAIQSVSHVDSEVHESMLRRIRHELTKHS